MRVQFFSNRHFSRAFPHLVRRFDPNFRRIWELVREGKIGKVHLLRITSRDPEPPPISYIKVSGGLFLDMAIHDFDMARYLIGSEVDEIFTLAGVMVDPEIGKAGDVDTAIINLRFENGVLGTIDNSRQAAYGYDQRVEVFGSKGMLATGNNTPTRVQLSDSESVRQDLPLHFFMERYLNSYLAELKAFAECVLQDNPPLLREGTDASPSSWGRRPASPTRKTAP